MTSKSRSVSEFLQISSGDLALHVECDQTIATHLLEDPYPRYYIPQYKALSLPHFHDGSCPKVLFHTALAFSCRHLEDLWEYGGTFSLHAIAPMLEYIFEYYRQLSALCTVHASAVEVDGKAVLILGCGKTRLSFELEKLGAHFVADDRTILNLNNESVTGGRTMLLNDLYIFERYHVHMIDGYGELLSSNTPGDRLPLAVACVVFPRLGDSKGAYELCSWQRFFHEVYPSASQFFSIPRPIDYSGVVLPSLDTTDIAGKRARLVSEMGRHCPSYGIFGSPKSSASIIFDLTRGLTPACES